MRWLRSKEIKTDRTMRGDRLGKVAVLHQYIALYTIQIQADGEYKRN